MNENNLVFVSSLPRSGSTLLQRLLAECDSVYTDSESWIMLTVLDTPGEFNIESVYGRNTAFAAISEFIDKIPGESYNRAVKSYALELYGSRLPSGKTYYVDKTPRYYLVSKKLESLFGNSKHIYIKRNPLAVLASIYNSWSKNDLDSLINYQVDLVDGVRMLAEQVQVTRHKVISYENLVADPSRVIEELEDYLALDGEKIPYEYGPLKEKWSFGDRDRVNELSKPEKELRDGWVAALADEVLWTLLWNYLMSLEDELLSSLDYEKEDLIKILEESQKQYGHKPISLKIAGFDVSSFFQPSDRYKSKASFYELRRKVSDCASSVVRMDGFQKDLLREVSAVNSTLAKLYEDNKKNLKTIKDQECSLSSLDAKVLELSTELEQAKSVIASREEEIKILSRYKSNIEIFWSNYRDKSPFKFYKMKCALDDLVNKG